MMEIHCDNAQQALSQSATKTKCGNGNWVVDRPEMSAMQVMGIYPIQEVDTISEASYCHVPPE